MFGYPSLIKLLCSSSNFSIFSLFFSSLFRSAIVALDALCDPFWYSVFYLAVKNPRREIKVKAESAFAMREHRNCLAFMCIRWLSFSEVSECYSISNVFGCSCPASGVMRNSCFRDKCRVRAMLCATFLYDKYNMRCNYVIAWNSYYIFKIPVYGIINAIK